ncbi:MAG: EAL domain-containing protein [Dissulfurispiraceae bacterium]
MDDMKKMEQSVWKDNFNFISRKDILNVSNDDINKALEAAEWTILLDKKPYLKNTRDFKEKLYVAEILKGKDTHIRSVYQPIVGLKDHRIWAYEGLSRFTLSGNSISPLKVFEDALGIGLLGELDWACRAQVISSFPRQDSLLFINISPSVANYEYFGTGQTDEFLEKAGLSKDQIVLEITESGKVFDIDEIRKIVLYYKNAGYRLALDDFGMGYNSLGLFFSVANFVDYIKIPRELVHGISKSNLKLDLVRAIRDICLSNGKDVIVEGLEDVEDLESIINIGIDLAQGFLFSRPLETETLTDPAAFQKIVHAIQILQIDEEAKTGRGNIKHLLPVITINGKIKYRDFDRKLHDYLGKNPIILIEAAGRSFILDTLQYLGFVSDSVRKDLLHFKSFDDLVSNNYHWLKMLEDVPLCPQEIPSIFDLYLFFENNNKDIVIIKENGKPVYYATRDKIYKAMSDMLYIDRVSINPLTGLPGNRVIEERVSNLIKAGFEFWIGYVDLDNFKAFNDHYGFASGDMMLKRLGAAMELQLKERYDNNFFLGHIGGDDFLFTLNSVSRKELEGFAHFFASTLSDSIVTLYNDNDRNQGFFIGEDRDGNARHFPLAAVSMAIASSKGKNSYIDISRTLAILKKKTKMQVGTAYAIEVV